MTAGATVITVTRNIVRAGREAMLEQCLHSVHEQTVGPAEHIVIDGASEDGTAVILEKYRKKGWIRYVSEPDSGLYHAMNKGLALASEPYAAFLNSDDFYHDTTWLERCLNELRRTGADCCSAPVLSLCPAGRTALGHIPNWPAMFEKMSVNHQSLLMRTSVLRALGGFSQRFPVQADYELLLRFLLCGWRYTVLSFPGCTFRNYGMASQKTWPEIITERLRIQGHVLGRFGASYHDCVDICDLGHVPGWLFRRLEQHIYLSHRPEFEEWHRYTELRALRRWLWTSSSRPEEEVFRLCGMKFIDRRFPGKDGSDMGHV